MYLDHLLAVVADLFLSGLLKLEGHGTGRLAGGRSAGGRSVRERLPKKSSCTVKQVKNTFFLQ